MREENAIKRILLHTLHTFLHEPNSVSFPEHPIAATPLVEHYFVTRSFHVLHLDCIIDNNHETKMFFN